MLHLHLLKGYGVLHLLWGYRQREIILNFQHIPSILITPKILSILNFPIIQIFLATDNIDSWLSGRAFQALSCQCVDRMIG